ncbi:MAG TPA: hypothetical protein VHW69_12725 [Rhizomicrobium sp.]|jgi:hypothetical protein|nr:hypothetical protein [Rhizomicrobium sp.]
MKRVEEYLRNARECRAIAARTGATEGRGHFIRMAEIWEALAREQRTIIEGGFESPEDKPAD